MAEKPWYIGKSGMVKHSLLAAAPELYEALEAVSTASILHNPNSLWHRLTHGELAVQVEAALAKAKGEST